MARQLVLLEDGELDWRLDERTKEIGRQGVAQARKALEEARRRALLDEHKGRSAAA